jgi:folylpolyglutamate synthase/dihydropteroate synthase
VAGSLKDALQVAGSAVSREDIICVCGSFYLAGEVKKLLPASAD